MPPLSDSTIDEQIAADWKAIQEKHAAPDEPEVKTEQPIEAISEPEAVDVPHEIKDDRARDEQGKFAKPAQAAADKQPAATTDQAQPITADAAQQRDINRAPSTWKPQERLEWDKLTPATRAAIHRREADFQNGQAQLLPDAKLGSDMRKVVEPYRMVVESNYGTPENAMQAFLQTASALQMGSQQQKLQTIVGIAQQFGIDLNPLFKPVQPGQQQPQQFTDPRVDQLLAHQREQDQQRQQRDQREIEGNVTRWMNEKDAAGNPLRPYVGDVINELSVLIPQIRQADSSLTHLQALEQAYDRAVWANPDVRAALQGQQQTELANKQRLDSQDRVRDARRTASVNMPRRASLPSPAKPGSMVETIESTARELGLIT